MSSSGQLYVVATPIGNVQDLSPRAREVLSSVGEILCEDTRVTRKLLERLEINTHASSIHQHSTDKELQNALDKLQAGASMAYVSDAGTPNVSDPGGKLVARAAEEGIEIVTIPGPSAVMAALQVCGFPADSFTFLGFPPHKKGRQKYFDKIEEIEHTVALFESKHRIMKTLEQLPQDRPMFIGRELTKMHESMYRGIAPELMKELEADSTKGEFVIVLSPKNWTV